MTGLGFGLVILVLIVTPRSSQAEPKRPQTDAEAFQASSARYQEIGADKPGAIEVFQEFIERFPRSPKLPEAHFLVAEGRLRKALDSLRRDPAFLKDSSTARIPANSLKLFDDAESSYQAALKKASDDGLKASITYRLGEVAYNRKDWAKALAYFKSILSTWTESYLVPEALLGTIDCALALDDYDQAEKALVQLTQGYPQYSEDRGLKFAQGIMALHKGDYPEAEKLLSGIDTPEARFYLAKTYLTAKKPLLAASLFDRLVKDLPNSTLRESAAFYQGDSFFVSQDYDGAVVKYEELLKTFPFSKFKVAALYRIGSSRFQKKEYGQARLSMGSMISQFPNDFYAPIAQYVIGESYLTLGQMRESLFAYSKVITQYKERGSDMEALALQRLAWAQEEVGEYAQAAVTCDNFLVRYSTHALARNVLLIKGNSLVKLKKNPEALAAYQKILDASATSADISEQALFLMLKIQYDQKDYGSILTSYQFQFKQLPPSKSKWRALAYLMVGESYLALNQPDEAREIYATVLKMYPDETAALYAQDGLAWCFQMKGMADEALEARLKLKEMTHEEHSKMDFAKLNDLGMADSYFTRKDYSEAYQYYDKFSKEQPDSSAAPAALYRAGLSLYHLRYYGQAIETWKTLIERHPQAPESQNAAFQSANTIFRSGKYAEAVALYKGIIERYPSSPQLPLATLRLAQAAYQMKDPAEVLKQAEHLLFTYPKAPETADAFELAEAVFDASHGAYKFEDFFQSVIQADPRGSIAGEAQFRLARRHYENKDYVRAAEEFQRFSVGYTLHPSLPKAQLLLGESYFNLSKFQEAAFAYGRYLDNYPGEPEAALALLRMGSAYFSIKEFAKAAGAYDRLVKEFPGSEYAKAAQFNLALSHKSAGDLEAAEAAYGKYAAEFANEDEALAAYWETLNVQKEKKDYVSALKTMLKIQEKAPKTGEIALEVSYRLGELYGLAGDVKNSRQAWEIAAAMKPADNAFRIQALIKLAEGYEKSSEWKKAIAAYQDLARTSPSADMAAAAREKIAYLMKLQSSQPEPVSSSGGPQTSLVEGR